VLVEEKGKKAKAFGILTKPERKRRNTFLADNLESLLRNQLLLAAVPPLEWEAARMTHSEDPNPPGAFSPFPPWPPQPADRQPNKPGFMPSSFF